MNMMATVGASTWAASSLPVSRLEVNKIGVAITCTVRGSTGVSPKAVNYLVCC